MSSGRFPTSVVLLLAVILGSVGAWVLLREDGAGHDMGIEEQDAQWGTVRREPGLLGATGPRERGRAGAVRETATTAVGTPAAVPARRAPKRPRHTVRVLDATGRPIYRAAVTLRMYPTPRTRHVQVSTGRDGRASFRLPPGRVIAVTVTSSGKQLLSITDRRGIDLGRLGDVRSEDLYLLNVRTVDDAGVPRPTQRVLYRSRVEGKQPMGWTGSTSDAEGWCRLGPFAFATVLEIRAGPRGLEREALADPAGWHEVRVDGGEVDLVVGEAPRLQLVFPGAPPGTRLTITLLNRDTGARLFPPVQFDVQRGVWTAEALREDVPLEVVILDARKGLFARLRDIVPMGRPQDVRLERGRPITGRVVASGVHALESGLLTVAGRGFQTLTFVGPRGRFKFAGLPDVSFTIHARVKADADGDPWYVGQVTRTQETELRIPVGRAVRVVGKLGPPGVEVTPRPFTVEATSPDWTGTRSRTMYMGYQFRFELPVGRWRLTARGASSGGATLEAVSDLGHLNADREDVVLHLLQVGR